MKFSSNLLRALVRDGVPMTPESADDLPWKESDRDDGMMHLSVCGVCDEFPVSVNLRRFLCARFGLGSNEIALRWDPLNWEYTAIVPDWVGGKIPQGLLDEYDWDRGC